MTKISRTYSTQSTRTYSKTLRDELAFESFLNAEDKSQIEKEIHVSDAQFAACIQDANDHHKRVLNKRGFIRTYYKPFWIKHKGGMGKTYQMGIVLIKRKNG